MTIYECSICGGTHRSEDPPCVQTFVVPLVDARPWPDILRERALAAGYVPLVDTRPWPDILRERALAAGYGDVFIGQCDVEGTDAAGESLCRNDHKDARDLRLVRASFRGQSEVPEIRALLAELGIPITSASCHWVGLDRRKMTKEQLAPLEHRRYWVNERWRDNHRPGCPRLENSYAKCDERCDGLHFDVARYR